jgi:hypothetical protein
MAVPFTAMPGDLISVNFISNTPLDLHIISAPYFPETPDIFCGFGVPPGSLFEVAYRTSDSVQWSPSKEYYLINKLTQYLVVLDNWQTIPASVYLSIQETPGQMVTSTISATSILTLTYTTYSTQALSNTQSIAASAINPSGQTPENSQWLVFLVLIPVILIVALFLRRRKGSW